jgi:hypothetical protein
MGILAQSSLELAVPPGLALAIQAAGKRRRPVGKRLGAETDPPPVNPAWVLAVT